MPFLTISNFLQPLLFPPIPALSTVTQTPADALSTYNNRIFASGNNSLHLPILSSLTADATFPGFDFAADPGALLSGPEGNATWSWTVSVTNLAANGSRSDADKPNGTRIAQTTHTLQFKPPVWPTANATNWTACAYTFLSDLPLNMTSRPKDNNGSCNAVLGETCVTALIARIRSRSPERSRYPPGFVCPDMPYWLQLPECLEQMGGGVLGGPQVLYTSLLNVTTGSFQEPGNNDTLYSNQVFWSERSEPVSATNTTAYNTMATRTQFMMLVFAPNNEWVFKNGGREGVNETIMDNTVVLPMCLRADGGGSAFSGGGDRGLELGWVWLKGVVGAVGSLVMGGLVI